MNYQSDLTGDKRGKPALRDQIGGPAPTDGDYDPAGGTTSAIRSPQACPRCWGDLSALVYVDWCPSCRKNADASVTNDRPTR
jgi:hypothetical protein